MKPKFSVSGGSFRPGFGAEDLHARPGMNAGVPGRPGADGVTFFPHVSEDGVLSWTNNGGLLDPEPVEIKGAADFTTDGTLTMTADRVLKVNTAKDAEADNTLPITSAAVYTEIGNIDALLKTI